jgi:membrane-bound lytic murein transglycosylase D
MVPESPVVSDTVTIDHPVDLRLVADLTNASLPEIVALNPSLLRMTTPRDISFDLHIPVGMSDVFNERIKNIPEDKRANWRFHVVRAGESLDGIASALHARPSEIAEANGIAAGETVDVGDELVIPVAVASAGDHPQHYTVRHGDTLVTVADRFGVSVEQLKHWNHLTSSTAKPGRVLTIAEPVRLAPGVRTRSKKAHVASASHSTSTQHTARSTSAKPSSTKRTSTSKPKSTSPKSKSKAAR